MRASGQKEYISLAKGLVTEASMLNFPEGATADELNFILDKDGFIRKRRKGFTEVRSAVPFQFESGELENVYYWQAPDVLLFVVTDDTPATRLLIHRNDSDLTLLGTFTLNTGISETEIAEYTTFVAITTAETQKPVLLEYKEADGEIVTYTVDISIRDFELVDDELSITERPLVLTDDHKYNLYNSGWYLDRRIQPNEDQEVGDPILAFFLYPDNFKFPSNADSIAIGVAINENGRTTFDPDILLNTNLGNTETPRGHYIYSVNDFDRDSKILDKNDDGAESSTLSEIGRVGI